MDSRSSSAATATKDSKLYAVHRDDIVLVLLDMTMPGLDGASTLRALRDTGAKAPIVLMSGFAEQEATRRVTGQEIAGFVQKPFRADALVKLVADVLGTREAGH
jgi:DNA-binding NtrC family response regulator